MYLFYSCENVYWVFIGCQKSASNYTPTLTGSISSSKLRWTRKQKQITVQYFEENIRKKKAPTETDIETFKEEFPCMDNKDWKKIKAFIFNEYSRDAGFQNEFERHVVNSNLSSNEQGCIILENIFYNT